MSDLIQATTEGMQERGDHPVTMDAALKARWVEALRSGEYKQGKLDFERNGRFCCLGVLCKIAGKPTNIDGQSNWGFIYEAFGPGEIDDPEGRRWPLIRMNDGGRSFAEIADYIEAHL